MGDAQRSPFPETCWLPFVVKGNTADRPLVFQMSKTVHTISLTTRGRHDIRWITHGRERRWHEEAGTVHFAPADDEPHTFVTSMSVDCESRVLVLPRRHLSGCLEEDGCDTRVEWQRMLLPDDATLRSCIARLSTRRVPGDIAEPRGVEEAARRLLLRIGHLHGAALPDWRHDGSVFDMRTLTGLVGHVDEHLEQGSTLGEMARIVGLSPSHFAKKFRQSTGLSLHRFVNQRRLRAALEILKDGSRPLVHVARDLGFASQSHFTRLFSGLTGMTPAKYRKQFRRTVG